jgi:osmotically-inducible protein OsmY
VAAGHDAQRLARGASRNTANQLRGAAAEARSRARGAPVSDRQLHERIRAELGQLVDQPSQVEVNVSNGFVTLGGSIKPPEMERLIGAVSAMQGVEHVENRLSAAPGAAGAQGTQPPGGRTTH